MRRSARENQAARNAATYVALAGLLTAALAILLLVALVLPQVLGIVAVLFAFLFFGVFHYLVWGWWFESQRPASGENAWDAPQDADRDEF